MDAGASGCVAHSFTANLARFNPSFCEWASGFRRLGCWNLKLSYEYRLVPAQRDAVAKTTEGKQKRRFAAQNILVLCRLLVAHTPKSEPMTEELLYDDARAAAPDEWPLIAYSARAKACSKISKSCAVPWLMRKQRSIGAVLGIRTNTPNSIRRVKTARA